MPHQQNSTSFKIISLAVTITYPVLLGVSSWAVLEILDHDKRLEVIESNRYTRDDASTDRAVHTARIEELNRMQSNTEIYLREISNRLERIDDKMTRYHERDTSGAGN